MDSTVMQAPNFESLMSGPGAEEIVGSGRDPAIDMNHCFVLCKKLGPNVFLIKNGLAVVDEDNSLYGAGTLSAKCLTKLILLPE